MIKKIFQSPLFNAALLLLMGLALLREYFPTIAPAQLQLSPWVLIVPIFLLTLFIPIHNRIHPKEKVKPTLIPMEFREEDEGLKWMTLKGTRRVYIFYVFSIPLAMLLVSLFQHIPYFSVLLLAVIGATQYIIYWFEVRKLK
ncbi:hypothetical protein FZW96_19720 [Bacillus sp. BGMRC 2118]|nr:hypothetical protein FZW96_19720 [Bacillus sp. BGMRC 2118]